MADIELVIKIEEETYNRIMNGWMPLYKAVNLMENVQKGTPLPKGHGRLIDADDLLLYTDVTECGYKPKVSRYQIVTAPTIVEADKVEREE